MYRAGGGAPLLRRRTPVGDLSAPAIAQERSCCRWEK
jgi:hypothetical protein